MDEAREHGAGCFDQMVLDSVRVGVTGLEVRMLVVAGVMVRCGTSFDALTVRTEMEEWAFIEGGFWSCCGRELISSIHNVEQKRVKRRGIRRSSSNNE